MKIKLFIILLVIVGLTLFSASSYAYYERADVKTDIKNVDDGVVITVTSDDPAVVKDIQADRRYCTDGCYYKDVSSHDNRCPHMDSERAHHHSDCCW